ncbi:hypothetical protein ABBQ32_013085 [Trebouxia sp. C0010 RCD-2024]
MTAAEETMSGLGSASELRQVLAEWNKTTVPFRQEVCIHELFQQQAAANPLAECLVFCGATMTYALLDQKTNQLARHLQTLGVQRDVPVAVMMERSFDIIIAVMAVLKAGGAYLPMDPAYPQQRLAYMVQDAKAPVLLTHQHLHTKLPEGSLNLQVVDLDQAQQVLASYPETSLQLPCSSTDAMYLIYTSGSTGNPKGVMLNHVGFVNLLDWSIREYGLSSQTNMLLKTAVSFDPSVFEIFAPLALGGRLVIAKPGGHEDARYVRDLINLERVTFAIMVPTALPFFLDACAAEGTFCPGLQQLCLIGEAFGRCLAQRACEVLPHTGIYNIYGPTEATIWVSSWRCNGANFDGVATSPIGGPMANTHLYVLDEELQPVPIGEKGELYISGICLARGYKGKPDLTAERYVRNPFSQGETQHARMYKTGDEAWWRADGVLVFMGRMAGDQQVKLRGFRIELTEIEHHLSSFKGIQQVIVAVLQDSMGQQHLVAYVSPAQTDIHQLNAHAARVLPKHMIPETFVPLDEFPTLPNGKVDRNSLPKPQYEHMAEADYVAPSSPLEEQIQQVWSDILGIRSISCSANFFQIGGTSLLGVMLASRLQSALHIQIPPSQLFTSRTISELAAFASQAPHLPHDDSATSSCTQHAVGVPAQLSASQKAQGVYCTLNQEVMVLSHQLCPCPTAFSMPFAVRLRGPLDVALLGSAIGLAVHRQEVLLCHLKGKLVSKKFLARALRKVIGTSLIGNRMVQSMLSNDLMAKMIQKRMQGKAGLGTKMVLPLVKQQVGLYQIDAVDEYELPKALSQTIATAFDLAKGPLVRATLIPLANTQEHVLVVNMHYAVADGWSLGVLFKDISSCYNGLKRSTAPEAMMPQLPMGFLEHAHSARNLLHAKQMADLQWWCARLAGASLEPLLKTDFPRAGRANMGQNQGDIVKVHIPKQDVRQLRQVAQKSGSSLYVTVLAAFKVLLRRFSGREDLVVGTPTSGRNRPDLEGGLVGCFVNLTMLRTSLAGSELTFRELVQRVHETVASALAHADVAQMQVIAELARRQHLLAFNAIPYQVLFALHDKTLLSGLELDGVTTCSVDPIHTGSSKVDIFLELFEACDGSVVGQIEYDSSLWLRSSMQAMATTFSVSLGWQKL